MVLCKPVRKTKDSVEDDERREEYPLLRNFTVFSPDQVEGEAGERLRTASFSEPTGSLFQCDFETRRDPRTAESAAVRDAGCVRYGRRLRGV